jgi:hypothetical protein
MTTSNSSSNVSIEYSFGSLETLLEVQEHFRFSNSACAAFRNALNIAAGSNDSSSNQNLDWRYRISRWLLKASDELDLNRETALIALAYSDRFMISKVNMSSRVVAVEKEIYQLAAITSLFIASKLYEKKPLKMAKLLYYTQNIFQKQDILSIEGEILQANATFMYNPTASGFALMFLNGLSGNSEHIKLLIENVEFLIQLAACDFFFINRKPSAVAVAAITVALEQDDLESTLNITSHECLQKVASVGLNLQDKEIDACIGHLKAIFEGNQSRITEADSKYESKTNATACTPTKTGRVTPSPTAEIVAKFSGNNFSGNKRNRDQL